MENLEVLTKEEISTIDGGWNLIEYAAMAVGYINGKLSHPAPRECTTVYTNGSYMFY